MSFEPTPATIPGATHHTVGLKGADLHYVTAGDSGSPILLVHGFPETWWAFRRVIPILAREHRVVAVDLRGFGDSSTADANYDSATAADDLHHLISHLGVGPVHLLGQDISGATVYRLAAAHPEDVLSLIAVETGLAGFGAEMLADVTHGGAWYIGALTTPGIPELLFAGREREFIADSLYPSYGATAPALTPADTDEFVRTYARPGGLRGAAGLYRSMLTEGDELTALAAVKRLTMPILAVGSLGGPFTANTMRNVAAGPVSAVELPGVGHYIAQEAPDQLAEAISHHVDRVDSTAATASR
jgi:pimeloyl-ACP methyl ester carboxylesterase